jgi:hypothetical protein
VDGGANVLVLRAAIASAALALALAAARAVEAGEERLRQRPDLDAVTTGNNSELVKSIAIRRRAAPSRTVVMSLKLPDLAEADRIKVIAELTITNTCVVPGRRCIGRRYRYHPRVGGQVRLARRRNAAGRGATIPLTERRSLACSQRLPNRNHHCPIVFAEAARRLPAARDLPCRPDDCHLNFVLDAHHRNARPGQRLVVGTDRPNGTIAQDRGRLIAIVFREGLTTRVLESEADRARRRSLSMLSRSKSRKGRRRVTYSARVPSVERGTVISAEAHQRLGIGHLPYSAFMGTELFLSSRRAGTSPGRVAHRSATLHGRLTERSGFNCTQGPSAFRTPCESHRAGIVELRRVPRKEGRALPLYVNLVSRTWPKRTSARRGDRAKILPRGGIKVVAYSPHAE